MPENNISTSNPNTSKVPPYWSPSEKRLGETLFDTTTTTVFSPNDIGAVVQNCQKKKSNQLDINDKAIAALAAIGSISLATALGDSEALLEIDSFGLPYIEGTTKTVIPEWGKGIISGAMKIPKFSKTVPGLKSINYNAAKGTINIGKNKVLGIHGGKYKLSSLIKKSGSLKTQSGAKLLKGGAVTGAIVEVGSTIVKYATDPDKSFKSTEFAEDMGTSTVKGAAKGASSSLIIAKCTAAGTVAGTGAFGIGAPIGAAIGFIAGVAIAYGAGKVIDKAIDCTWEKAKEIAPKVKDWTLDRADDVKEIAFKTKEWTATRVKDTKSWVGSKKDEVWDGSKKALSWAKSWF